MDTQGDFKILNPPKSPHWRDPAYKARRQRRNFVVALVSILCFAVCLVPPKNGFSEAISLQLARGEAEAWMLFGLMGAGVLSAFPTLIKVKRYLSGLFCLMVVFGLWALASTSPTSTAHLTAFVYLAMAILAWARGLACSLADSKLYLLAMLASLGAFGCLFSFGIGERMMIFSSLAILNTLLLSDLLE